MFLRFEFRGSHSSRLSAIPAAKQTKERTSERERRAAVAVKVKFVNGTSGTQPEPEVKVKVADSAAYASRPLSRFGHRHRLLLVKVDPQESRRPDACQTTRVSI